MRRTADGLAPLMLVGALILLVVLGAGAFKKPGYRGTSRAPAPGGADAVAATGTATPTRKPKSKPRRHAAGHRAARHGRRARNGDATIATPRATAAPVSTPPAAATVAPRPVVAAAPPKPAATSAPRPPAPKPKPRAPAPSTTTIDDSG